ncbi:MAG: hypothetical protein A2Y31_10790 [Spirochaetes bacterium GWC2_52_13]|nr:MAG: hypothetical protein A2Y31_10790 [Spirochaetes bacterium GWC2_52_13]PKL03528.1 MAG: transcriptional regulator [Spirochaetae bacterium HGW-Spirochaetae-9]HCG63712.1 transcriptional regulator [Sphaerochaeta sp.]
MDENVTKISQHLLKLKALSDETRLDIISLLANGPLCACDILESFKITQPTLSYHMKMLTGSNLVDSVRKGKWMHYSLNQAEFSGLIDYLGRIPKPGNRPVVRSSCCGGMDSCDSQAEQVEKP